MEEPAAEEPTHRQMTKRLKDDGIWISSCESMGLKWLHSKWWMTWNDENGTDQIEVDGTDAGHSKAWAEKLAKEKFTEARYKKEYPAQTIWR